MSMSLRALGFIALLALPLVATAQSSSDREERRREQQERAREQARERAQREAERRAEREKAASLDTTVAFDARGSVNVTCPGGTVVVTATDRNEIRVRARSENGAIRFSSTGSRATLEPSSGRGCSDGRFEVTVPVGTRLTATTWSGSVSVRGVHGDVEAHAQSGDVEVRDAGDRLDVETLSGDVNIAGVKGELNVRTVSGDLTVTGVRGNVEIETVSGDIELRDIVSKQIRTHTTSGDVSFTGSILEAGRYEFNTHSGEIGLNLPADIGAQLTLSTFNGGIESDFPITLSPGIAHGIGSAQSKRYTFTVGKGSARIVAESFSGDITLRRRGR